MSIPWTCSRCLLRASRPLKPLARRNVRFQSTSQTSEALSPILLLRARSFANEHSQLSEKLLDDYDIKVAKRTGELSPIVETLKAWDKANDAITELHSIIRDPSSDNELRDLAAEDLTTSKENLEKVSQSLTASLVPKHPFADMPCLLEIRPGAGGSEAGLFATELLRMYEAFCSSNDLRTAILKYDADGSDAGDVKLVEAVLEVPSPGAYGILRCEAGVHRVQRVPATEGKGRTHTSAVSVLVLPSFPENPADNPGNIDDPNSDFYLDPSEVKVEVMRAGGAGGQHVNKTESAVRLTHIPSKSVVSIQDSRSQLRNRDKAWQLLRGQIAQQRREAREEESLKARRSVLGVGKMGREDKIRTYNWGQSRVTDHRSGMSTHDLAGVLEGGMTLDKIMESVRSWLTDQEVKTMIAEDNVNANAKQS